MSAFKGKTIYNPSGKAGEYSYWACNFYNGCSIGCAYCFNKKGRGAKILGGNTPTLKKCFTDKAHALQIFEKELLSNILQLRQYGLFFSFTTDPMLVETRDLTYNAMILCLAHDVPVKILTKCADFVKEIKDNTFKFVRKNIAIGFTLTGCDELEPGASSNIERVIAMKRLHDAGFKTFASIEPVIEIPQSLAMINLTNGFCDLYKIGLESGKYYSKQDLQVFIDMINQMYSSCNIYFKDSLLNKAGIERSNLPSNCVTRDYNIFKR